MSNFITVHEAATQLGLTVRYVRQLCKDGNIKAQKISDKQTAAYIIPLSDFKRFKIQYDKKRASNPANIARAAK